MPSVFQMVAGQSGSRPSRGSRGACGGSGQAGLVQPSPLGVSALSVVTLREGAEEKKVAEISARSLSSLGVRFGKRGQPPTMLGRHCALFPRRSNVGRGAASHVRGGGGEGHPGGDDGARRGPETDAVVGREPEGRRWHESIGAGHCCGDESKSEVHCGQRNSSGSVSVRVLVHRDLCSPPHRFFLRLPHSGREGIRRLYARCGPRRSLPPS
jgi:hypothetical protein